MLLVVSFPCRTLCCSDRSTAEMFFSKGLQSQQLTAELWNVGCVKWQPWLSTLLQPRQSKGGSCCQPQKVRLFSLTHHTSEKTNWAQKSASVLLSEGCHAPRKQFLYVLSMDFCPGHTHRLSKTTQRALGSLSLRAASLSSPSAFWREYLGDFVMPTSLPPS